MATTTLGNSPTATDRTSLYWGIAIAIVLALAVILTVRTTSTRDTVNTPVERSSVPPIEVSPQNSDINQHTKTVDTTPPASSP